jgi:PAS domain S-box-containing protein
MGFGKRLLYRSTFLLWTVISCLVVAFAMITLHREKVGQTRATAVTAEVVANIVKKKMANLLVNGDYVAISDECQRLLQAEPLLRYLAFSPEQGELRVHTASGLQTQDLRNLWNPSPDSAMQGTLLAGNALVEEGVYHYSTLLRKNDAPWGWIHVGIALRPLDVEGKKLRKQTAWLTGLLLVVSFAVSLFVASYLLQPIRELGMLSRRVVSGEFSVPEDPIRNEELRSLASSVEGLGKTLEESRQELSAAQKYASNIMNSMADMLVVVDPKMNIRTVNRATCENLGYSQQELLKLTFNDIVSGGPFQGNRLRNMVERGTHRHQDLVYRTQDGQKLPVRFSGSVMRDAAFAYQGIICIASNNAEIQRLRQSYQQNEANHRTLADTSQNLIWQCERDLTLTYVNPACSSRCGYDASDMCGRPLADFLVPERVENDLNELKRCLNGESVTGHETSYRCKDGQLLQLIVTAVPLRDEQGEVTGIHSIAYDTMARKQAEAQCARLEQQLQQVKKMEAVGQLAGGIAHDFNNLLQAITGHCYVIRNAMRKEDPLAGDLHEIERAAAQASSLTNQLLTFSRRKAMRSQSLQVNDIIANVVKMLCRLIGANIDLCFHPGSDLPFILADQQQIEQVLMNLCINARDAIGSASGTITISTEKAVLTHRFCDLHSWAQEGEYVLLSVDDTGKGIPPEIREHIFEPFFTTKGIGKGTGLGLSTVYGIVQQHKGLIHLEDVSGGGTRFKVFLPVAKNGPERQKEVAEAVIPHGNEVILVAEDEDFVSKPLLRILNAAGYTTYIARDGREAVTLFRQHTDRIALAMLDIVMPNMCGDEVYKQVKAINPDIRVLFSSGYNPSELSVDFIKNEGLPLIKKPYDPAKLLTTIRAILDKDTAQFAKQGNLAPITLSMS